MPLSYLILVENNGHPRISFAPNKVRATEDAERMHKANGTPIYVYALVEAIGDKKYHYVIKNSDGLTLLDSRTQNNFEGYETEIGAKWVAKHAAMDIGLKDLQIEIV